MRGGGVMAVAGTVCGSIAWLITATLLLPGV